MPSRDSIVAELLDKLRNASAEELTEVVAFAELVHARRLKHALAAPTVSKLDELEAHAVAAGLLRLPDAQARKLSTAEAPPVLVGGTPASQIVLEDRR